jgi:hypothetical protein
MPKLRRASLFQAKRQVIKTINGLRVLGTTVAAAQMADNRGAYSRIDAIPP